MYIKNFKIYWRSLLLVALLLGILCVTGCLERGVETEQTKQMASIAQDSPAPEDRLDSRLPMDSGMDTNSGLLMDYDLELSSNLFRLKGDLLFSGSSSLAYVLLNATLRQRDKPVLNTKYLLMQIEPNREYGFEICKNCRLAAGEYDCALRAESPQGIIAEDSRKVSLAQFRSGIGQLSEAEEAAFWRMVEENDREGTEREEDQISERGREEDQIADSVREEDYRGGGEGDENMVAGPSRSQGAQSDGIGLEETSRPEDQSEQQSSEVLASDDSSMSSSLVGAPLVGSITSKKYHLPDCRYAQKIKPENLIRFSSVEDAREEGYVPCKVCRP